MRFICRTPFRAPKVAHKHKTLHIKNSSITTTDPTDHNRHIKNRKTKTQQVQQIKHSVQQMSFEFIFIWFDFMLISIMLIWFSLGFYINEICSPALYRSAAQQNLHIDHSILAKYYIWICADVPDFLIDSRMCLRPVPLLFYPLLLV